MFRYLILFLLPLFLISCTKEDLPKVPVRTLDGKTLYLSDYKGKKILLYIWSKTCAGHTTDLKELNRLVEERKDYMILSYAVAMEPEDVIESYRMLGIKPNFITLVDTEVKFNDHFPITFLPSTFVFDERGRFVKSSPGLNY